VPLWHGYAILKETIMHNGKSLTDGGVIFPTHLFVDEIISLPPGVELGGNKKVNAKNVAVSYGGSGGSGAFHAARCGFLVDLLAQFSNDSRGPMILKWIRASSINFHYRLVNESSVSYVFPDNGGYRFLIKRLDLKYLQDFPRFDVGRSLAMYGDKYNEDARDWYLDACNARRIFTFLDIGDGIVPSDNGDGKETRISDGVLRKARVVIAAEEFGEPLGLMPLQVLDYFEEMGCEVAGVTLGKRGMIWFDEKRMRRHMPALDVPRERILDPSGTGDVHNVFAFLHKLRYPTESWANHFQAARNIAAHKLLRVGHINLLATLEEAGDVEREFQVSKLGAEALER
jgi:sugar/nucleoside kinase (ribokinase family)